MNINELAAWLLHCLVLVLFIGAFVLFILGIKQHYDNNKNE